MSEYKAYIVVRCKGASQVEKMVKQGFALSDAMQPVIFKLL